MTPPDSLGGGLTPELRGATKWHPLERFVRPQPSSQGLCPCRFPQDVSLTQEGRTPRLAAASETKRGGMLDCGRPHTAFVPGWQMLENTHSPPNPRGVGVQDHEDNLR